MPRFFDNFRQYINLRNACIIYNGLTSLAVLYDLWNNPDANPSEYAIDISIHALTAVILMCKQAPDMVKDVVIALNTYRGFDALFKAITPLPSTIPYVANGIDVLNHWFNLKELTKEESEENRQEAQCKIL
ncbi:hypothetical protein LEAN103870_04160 [Legionella anisa]|uniref:Uncharacterized protein n=1 Tax=Legionella anisa TaxID=28082 RepID=A0AAX0WSI4_9GAMM|nr:hypothetical protein [Legionella anisa]AWN72943.1 hypothetical protein DLD14_03305 [Legionella anisa]KTC70601.1 hypothetical protein Lani_2148 [Legionella anisa]MBN5935112.1 hypothetical protein [Legionella anisa]MCW8423756.1 hypothetical protein [Legionella anisa]MCW8447276.1 hypothetical protein [Legionella anisa]